MRSRLWILPGAVFGIAGGALAYAAVRRRDRALANKCLHVGMASSSILILAFLVSVTVWGVHTVYWPPELRDGYHEDVPWYHPGNLAMLDFDNAPFPEGCHNILHGHGGSCLVTGGLQDLHGMFHAQYAHDHDVSHGDMFPEGCHDILHGYGGDCTITEDMGVRHWDAHQEIQQQRWEAEAATRQQAGPGLEGSK